PNARPAYEVPVFVAKCAAAVRGKGQRDTGAAERAARLRSTVLNLPQRCTEAGAYLRRRCSIAARVNFRSSIAEYAFAPLGPVSVFSTICAPRRDTTMQAAA